MHFIPIWIISDPFNAEVCNLYNSNKNLSIFLFVIFIKILLIK